MKRAPTRKPKRTARRKRATTYALYKRPGFYGQIAISEDTNEDYPGKSLFELKYET